MPGFGRWRWDTAPSHLFGHCQVRHPGCGSNPSLLYIIFSWHLGVCQGCLGSALFLSRIYLSRKIELLLGCTLKSICLVTQNVWKIVARQKQLGKIKLGAGRVSRSTQFSCGFFFSICTLKLWELNIEYRWWIGQFFHFGSSNFNHWRLHVSFQLEKKWKRKLTSQFFVCVKDDWQR